MIRHTIQEEVGMTSSGDEPTDLKIEPLPDNYIVCLQNVCVTNNNKNGSVVDIGIIVGGSIMWIDSVEITSRGIYYSWNGEVFFRSVKSIILRFNDTDNGDKLEGYVYGYYLD